MFTLVVQLCEKPEAHFAEQKSLPTYTGMQGCIAIVDDDVQVLDALETLLTGWGLQVACGRIRRYLMRSTQFSA